MFSIHFLGTSASAPSARRGLSSAVVMFEAERFLIDCGEGTQRQILRSGVGFRRLDKIFLTHRHLDHILGLGGLASTFGRWGSMEAMQIWGSPDTLRRVRRLMKVVFNARWESNDRISLVPMHAGIIFKNRNMHVEAFEVAHRRTPCFGFVFQERAKRRFLEERAQALEVPFGPVRGDLIKGMAITLDSGRVIQPDEVLGDPIAGTKLCFISDVGCTDSLYPTVADADLLVIEGTYLERDQALAREYGHITVASAARMARATGVRNLAFHHVGRRYEVDEIVQEAQTHFPATIVVSDLDLVEIQAGGVMQWKRWAHRRKRR